MPQQAEEGAASYQTDAEGVAGDGLQQCSQYDAPDRQGEPTQHVPNTAHRLWIIARGVGGNGAVAPTGGDRKQLLGADRGREAPSAAEAVLAKSFDQKMRGEGELVEPDAGGVVKGGGDGGSQGEEGHLGHATRSPGTDGVGQFHNV